MYKILTSAIICLLLSGCAIWNKQHENKLYSFEIKQYENKKDATKFKFSQFLQSELDAFFWRKDSLGANGNRKMSVFSINTNMEFDVNYDYVLKQLGKSNAPDYKIEDTSNMYIVYTIINTDKMSKEWQSYKIHDRLILKFNRNTRQLYDLEIDKQKSAMLPVYTSTYPDDCSSSAKPTKMSDIIKAFSYYWLVDSLANNGFRGAVVSCIRQCKNYDVDYDFVLKHLGTGENDKKITEMYEESFILTYLTLYNPTGYQERLKFRFNARTKKLLGITYNHN